MTFALPVAAYRSPSRRPRPTKAILQAQRTSNGLIGKKAIDKYWNSNSVHAASLRELGFEFQNKDRSWLLPVCFDKQQVAEAYAEDRLDDALKVEITRCINAMIKAEPIFSQVLQDMRTQAGAE